MENVIDRVLMKIYLILLAIYLTFKEGMTMYCDENTSKEK